MFSRIKKFCHYIMNMDIEDPDSPFYPSGCVNPPPFYSPCQNQLMNQNWTPPIDYSLQISQAHLEDLKRNFYYQIWLTKIPNDIY